LALVLAVFVAVSMAQLWPCTFTDPNGGYKYDFTPVNTNTSDSKGQWQQIDTKLVNWFFWKLCDPTLDTPSGFTPCATNTQVCMQPGTPPDKSCGIGPPTVTYIANGGGVVMRTAGGFVGCNPSVARSVQLNLLCASKNGKPDKSVDQVIESTAGCQYTINQYFNAACGTTGPIPTPPPPKPIPTPSRIPKPTPTPTPTYQPNSDYCCVYSNSTNSQCPCIEGGCVNIPGYSLQFSFPANPFSCVASCTPFCASKTPHILKNVFS